jgi:spermidine synthase
MGEPRLELAGERVHARLLPERGTNGGYSLVIDGTTQSHVNPVDPLDLQLEYARLVAAVIDECRDAGEPLRVLHLGAGALTIPRYVGATRPGSVQHVVELHRELFDFVLEVLPLDGHVELTVEFDDGRAAVQRAARTGGGYDIAVVDVFSGSVAPRHMSTVEFFRELGQLMSPDGVVVVNTLAASDLEMSREVAATLRSTRAEVIALSSPAVVGGSSLGNVVLVASDTSLPGTRIHAHADTGPRPIDLIDAEALTEFIGHAPVRHDGDDAG